MKVYLVFVHHVYSSGGVVGAFDTQEEAVKVAENINLQKPLDWNLGGATVLQAHVNSYNEKIINEYLLDLRQYQGGDYA